MPVCVHALVYTVCRHQLRCVIGIIRHGDRTPKQKMKMLVNHKRFCELFAESSGCETGNVKIKEPKQLQVHEIELPCLSGKRRLCITFKIQPAQLSCLGGSVGRVSAW